MSNHVLRGRNDIDDSAVYHGHFIGAHIAQDAVDFVHHIRNVFTMYEIYGIKAFICSWIVKVDASKITYAGFYAAERTKHECCGRPGKKAPPGTYGTEWLRG